MASGPDTTTHQSRDLRGANGLRGVRSRTGGRAAGSRQSSGRGPTPRRRWVRPGEPAPLAIDRVERLALAGLGGPLVAQLFAPARRKPLPLIVAWGAGGRSPRDLASDGLWARELADLTGAVVVLCGYRRGDDDDAVGDAVAAFTDLIARAAALGADPRRVAVTGRGAGFRLASRINADAAHWPALPTPRTCLAATPVPMAAVALRDALGLLAPPRPTHPLRPGTEVRTLDGVLLGRVGEVRDGDFAVRRGLTSDELHIPLRAVHRVHGAITLDVRASELALRAWGRGALPSARSAESSRN